MNYTRAYRQFPQANPRFASIIGPLTKNRGPETNTQVITSLVHCFLHLPPAPFATRPFSNPDLNGGGGRIRTTEAYASDLQSDPFDRSGTPPQRKSDEFFWLSFAQRRHSMGISLQVQRFHRDFLIELGYYEPELK